MIDNECTVDERAIWHIGYTFNVGLRSRVGPFAVYKRWKLWTARLFKTPLKPGQLCKWTSTMMSLVDLSSSDNEIHPYK
jgi:hypothetical protein